jgi:predicted double-glycine peptidase
MTNHEGNPSPSAKFAANPKKPVILLAVNLWLGGLLALLSAILGTILGLAFSRLRSPFWSIGYFLPLALIITYALTVRFPTVMFTPPLSWFFLGLKKFIVFGFVTTMVLTTPLSRINPKRARLMIALLTAIIVFVFAVFPFIAPLLNRRQLAQMATRMDKDGICLQSSDYTCGPAAAVTALRKLGFSAEEGQIGILSCTSFQEGTPVDMLADALKRGYGQNGLEVECRAFKSIADLRNRQPTLALTKFGLMVDHWLTVLEITDSEVIVADPLNGLTRLSYADFATKWRFIGIVLKRSTSTAQPSAHSAL